jgi:hypothetical protein
MNLFGKKRTKLYFSSAKLQRNRNGEKTASILFKVSLDGQNIRSTPDPVKMSFAACKDGNQTEAKLEGGIAVQNVTLYATDKSKATIKLREVIFDHIALQKSKDSEIYICMRTSLDISSPGPISNWVLGDFGTEQWGEFEDAQMQFEFQKEDEEEAPKRRGRPKKSDQEQPELPLESEEEGEEHEDEEDEDSLVGEEAGA